MSGNNEVGLSTKWAQSVGVTPSVETPELAISCWPEVLPHTKGLLPRLQLGHVPGMPRYVGRGAAAGTNVDRTLQPRCAAVGS